MRPLWTGDVADGSPGLVVGRLSAGFAAIALLASTAPAGVWRTTLPRFASARVSVCHSRASRSVLKVLRSVLRLGRSTVARQGTRTCARRPRHVAHC